MLIGYARISTDDQNLALQHDALAAAGCEKIYEDRISGARAERPGLALALEVARAGDTLVVWRLDRLGRSLKDLIALAERLEQRKVGLRSLKEALDTTSSGGRLIFHMFGALAEFERDLIRERTRAGLSRGPGARSARRPAEAADAREAQARGAALPRQGAQHRRDLPADGHLQADPLQLPGRGRWLSGSRPRRC